MANWLLLRYSTKQSRVNIKDFIVDVVIISMSASFLWHFSNIWRYGQHLVGEPNIVIRSLETAWFLFIFAFGVGKCIRDIKRLRRHRDASRGGVRHAQARKIFSMHRSNRRFPRPIQADFSQ